MTIPPRPHPFATYVKAGLEAGTKAAAEATQAAKQTAVFIVVSVAECGARTIVARGTQSPQGFASHKRHKSIFDVCVLNTYACFGYGYPRDDRRAMRPLFPCGGGRFVDPTRARMAKK